MINLEVDIVILCIFRGDEKRKRTIEGKEKKSRIDMEGYWLTCIVLRTVYLLTWRLSDKDTDTLIRGFLSNIWSCSSTTEIRLEQQVKGYGEIRFMLSSRKLMKGQAVDRLKPLFT